MPGNHIHFIIIIIDIDSNYFQFFIYKLYTEFNPNYWDTYHSYEPKSII